MKELIESNSEKLLGSWTINCIPFGSTRTLGKLYVTDKNLYYEAQYDMSLEGIVEQVAVSAVTASGHALLVSGEICKQWKDKGFMQIAKNDISEVQMSSSFFKKKLTLILCDGQSVFFDYGMLSVKKLKSAIEA